MIVLIGVFFLCILGMGVAFSEKHLIKLGLYGILFAAVLACLSLEGVL